jgi:hypothetical protein
MYCGRNGIRYFRRYENEEYHLNYKGWGKRQTLRDVAYLTFKRRQMLEVWKIKDMYPRKEVIRQRE